MQVGRQCLVYSRCNRELGRNNWALPASAVTQPTLHCPVNFWNGCKCLHGDTSRCGGASVHTKKLLGRKWVKIKVARLLSCEGGSKRRGVKKRSKTVSFQHFTCHAFSWHFQCPITLKETREWASRSAPLQLEIVLEATGSGAVGRGGDVNTRVGIKGNRETSLKWHLSGLISPLLFPTSQICDV